MLFGPTIKLSLSFLLDLLPRSKDASWLNIMTDSIFNLKEKCQKKTHRDINN